MTRRLIFRADGNALIGLGHVMRCLALADMLGNDFACRMAVVRPAPELLRLIEEHHVVALPLDTDNVVDLLAWVTAEDVVVLDGYAFGEDYQRAVRARARSLVFIDDLMTGRQVADVVINHAGGITAAHYVAEPYTQFYLGPHYALLRLPFLRPTTSVPADGPVFVSLGGADPRNATLQVMRQIRSASRAVPIRLVVGAFHQQRAAIDALAAESGYVTVRQSLSAADMAAELDACGLAVVACSTVAYEVAARQRPLIAIQTVKNQTQLRRFLDAERLAVATLGAGQIETHLADAVRNVVTTHPNVVAHATLQQRRYFDGRSPERFRALFAKLCS